MVSIDVAVPCYQYGGFLRDCVDSIRGQNAEKLRILIIDNGSTDNTLEVAQQIASEDERVGILARKKNQGIHASYNTAVEWAAAEYFMIVDADDVLVEGSIDRATAIMDKNPEVAFAHGVELGVYFPSGGAPHISRDANEGRWHLSSGMDFIHRICVRGENFVGAQTVVRRTSVQKQAGYYHLELDRALDLNMWLRLAMLGNVAETTSVQAVRRLHDKQLSAFYRDNPVRDFVELHNNIRHFLDHEGARINGAQGMCRLLGRRIAYNAFITALRLMRRGKARHSVEFMKFVFGAAFKERLKE